MRVEPAHIDQIREGQDGRMVLISADASSVAADLQEIDRGLKVRFAENGNPPFWAVFYESEDGRDTYLILTQKATMGRTGVWTGLDDRVVERIRYIDRDGRSDYDYAKALEQGSLTRKERQRKEFAEKVGDGAERTAHALRRDLGLGPPKGRIFKP